METTVSLFTPLEQETRSAIPTDAAAHHLNRQPQTLRKWACLENGPIRPVRINGRLAWRVSDLQMLLNGVTPPGLHTAATPPNERNFDDLAADQAALIDIEVAAMRAEGAENE